VFKGNYSVSDPNDPSVTISKTGVYYRELMDAPAGGTGPVIAIADAATAIPGTGVHFGAVAPPSAAGRLAVFTGWDNEWSPTVGGIYLAPLDGPTPPLRVLVRIGDRVPGEPAGTLFRNLGESLSFDGRFVAFWGTWGSATRTLVLQCPLEGNKDRLEYCRTAYPSGFTTTVPVHQGIFVHDTKTGNTTAVAKTPDDFTDFIYWNFSGMVPGMMGHPDEVGEPARWRWASFVAAGTEGREFTLTVENAGPDAATGVATVTATDATGALLPTFPRSYPFTILGGRVRAGPRASASTSKPRSRGPQQPPRSSK